MSSYATEENGVERRLRWEARLRDAGNRHQLVLVSAVTLVAVALRFHRLGQWSFWIDEIFTVQRVLRHANIDTLIREWWHPALSIALTGVALDTFDVSEWSARLVPALIGIASLPILYFPIRRVFGAPVALLSILLLAVAPWHLEWSQNARSFTCLLLFYTLAAYCFHLALEGQGLRYVVAFHVLAVFALGERFIGAFLAPVAVAYLLALVVLRFEKPPGWKARTLVPLVLPGTIAFGADLVRYLLTGTSFFLSWAALTYDEPVGSPLMLATGISHNIGIPLVCVALFAGLVALREKNRNGLFLLVCCVVPVLILLVLSRVTFTKDRYAFITLPFWIVLASVGVARLVAGATGSARTMALAVGAVLLADALAGDQSYFRENRGNRLEWRSAYEAVAELRSEGDQVVSWWPDLTRYYLHDPGVRWADIDEQAILGSGRRHWFVLDSETIRGNVPMKKWIERNGDLIAVFPLRRFSLDELRVYVYDPGRTPCLPGRMCVRGLNPAPE